MCQTDTVYVPCILSGVISDFALGKLETECQLYAFCQRDNNKFKLEFSTTFQQLVARSLSVDGCAIVVFKG